ncbi:hypothetical protein HK101_010503 [Irineochytrium annulatum]|nr:hypothetical protein HK101_010503 [Irineochytrium annulatum]
MPKTTNTRKPRASWDAPRITFLLKRYVKAVHQGLRTSNGQFKKGVADTFAAKLNEKFGDNLDGSQCSDKLNQLKREFAKVEAALRNSSGLGVKNGCIDAPPHVWEALVAAKGPLIPLRHAPFPNWEDSYFLFSGHTATGSEAPPPPGYGERVGDDAGGGGVAQQAASRATVAAGGMRPVGLRRQHGFDKTDAVDSNDDEDKENREKGNEDADELFV